MISMRSFSPTFRTSPTPWCSGLQQYLRRGGGLMIFPGARVNAAFYNEQLFARTQLLPASLAPARGEADQDQKYFTLQDKDYQHPMVALWNDPAAGTLGSARFYRAFPLNLPATGGTNAPMADAGLPEAGLEILRRQCRRGAAQLGVGSRGAFQQHRGYGVE
jgi:hypothetical protein